MILLTFNSYAWADGAGNATTHGGLVGLNAGNTAFQIAPTGAAVSGPIINTAGQILAANEDIILYATLGTVANAAQLAADLHGPVGYITFNFAPASSNFDMLVAYSTGTNIDIADVHFATTGGSASTNGAAWTISASDMVQITGQSSLLTLGTHIGDIQFVHV